MPHVHSLPSILSLLFNTTRMKNWATLKKLHVLLLSSQYGKKDHESYKVSLGVAIIYLSISRVFTALIPLLLGRIVNQLVDPAAGVPISEILVFIALRQVLRKIAQDLYSAKLSSVDQDIATQLKCELFHKLLSLSADFHDKKRQGRTGQQDHFGAICSGAHRFSGFVTRIAFGYFSVVLDISMAMVALGRMFGAQLVVTAMALTITYCWLPHRWTQKKQERSEDDRDTWTRLDREADSLGQDAVQHWHTVADFNNVAFEQRRFRDAAMRATEALQALSRRRHWAAWKTRTALAGGLLILWLVVTMAREKGHAQDIGSAGEFVTLLQCWDDISNSIQRFLDLESSFNTFFVQSDTMINIFEAPITIRDEESAPELEVRNGDIEFQNVEFSYPDREGKADNDSSSGEEKEAAAAADDDGHAIEKQAQVKDMSFTIRGGTTVAIVGESGGGKSTLLRLLCRKYDVSAGSIRIDGQDIRHVQLTSLLRHITVVPQTIDVFSDTVRANLQYGNLAATQHECEAACEAAALHKKIVTAFPAQYNEKIGKFGTKLSGGELQRLAIARAMLRHDAKIVLLDEAMSSLDSETEWTIQQRIRDFYKGRTVVIITHRLATAAHADLILAVKDGRIVESGTQAELLAKKEKGYFYSLWTKQRLLEEST